MASDDDPLMVCVACGRPLLGELEDDPVGEGGLPLCGDCNRARNFDAVEEPFLAADIDQDDEADAGYGEIGEVL